MANKIRYTIVDSTDRNGEDKKLPTSWTGKSYFIHHLSIGRSAILGSINGGGLETSTVSDITIWDNSIIITTRNTVYTLRPEVITDEQN